MSVKRTATGLGDLTGIAESLLRSFPGERIFVIKGEMGAGKTTFIKELCNCLEVSQKVTSPTFAIVNEYTSGSDEPVYHFDFYRVKRLSEIFDLGYEEYFFSGYYCFIEWPEIAEELLPENSVYVTIDWEKESGSRTFVY